MVPFMVKNGVAYISTAAQSRPEDYAEIGIFPGKDGIPTVYAAGKLLGPAKDVVEFILEGAASVERHRAPLSPWLEKARSVFQRTE